MVVTEEIKQEILKTFKSIEEFKKYYEKSLGTVANSAIKTKTEILSSRYLEVEFRGVKTVRLDFPPTENKVIVQVPNSAKLSNKDKGKLRKETLIDYCTVPRKTQMSLGIEWAILHKAFDDRG